MLSCGPAMALEYWPWMILASQSPGGSAHRSPASSSASSLGSAARRRARAGIGPRCVLLVDLWLVAVVVLEAEAQECKDLKFRSEVWLRPVRITVKYSVNYALRDR
jgi:hypothetical protein